MSVHPYLTYRLAQSRQEEFRRQARTSPAPGAGRESGRAMLRIAVRRRTPPHIANAVRSAPA